jgi:hypothetical protein
MKRHLPTIAIALACSIISAVATGWIISSHYQNALMIFIGGRPADYLLTAAKIREGRSDELVKFLEYNAQVEFLQNQYAKNATWTFGRSHRVLDAYMRKYRIELAEPFAGLATPDKPYSDDQFNRMLSIPAPEKWPDWFTELKKQ